MAATTLRGMGLFGPKRVACPANVWTTLVSNAFVQIPKNFDIEFQGDEPFEGQLEEKKSSWVFPGTPQLRPLQPRMMLERGYFNTFYRIRVRPTREVVAIIE